MDPETLCQAPGSTGEPPVDPGSLRTKADAIASCHTYLYPEVRMDCSSRGKPPSHTRRARRQARSWQNTQCFCWANPLWTLGCF